MGHLSATTPVARRDGFALIAVLVVTALALTAAGACLSVALSQQEIAVADADAAIVQTASDQGVQDLLEDLRWGWVRVAAPGSIASVGPYEASDGCQVSASVETFRWGDARWPLLQPGALLTAAPADEAAYGITVSARRNDAQRTLNVVAVATADALPRGLVVRGNARIEGPLELVGCGMYVGGDVSGREAVTLTSPPDAATPPSLPDLAYGGLYRAAGVHAGGAILLDGHEEHTLDGGIPGDSDADSGGGPPPAIVAGDQAGTVAELAPHAGSLQSGALALDRIPTSAPGVGDDPALPANGRVIVVDATAAACTITGSREPPPLACPVTVVVLGDCAVEPESAGATTGFTGALIVTGELVVRGPFRLDGSLQAGRLLVASSAVLDFAAGRVQESPPGASNLHIVTWNY